MIKRFMMAAPVAALVLGSSFAMAAETITVQLKADVPSAEFYVRPVAGVDLSKVQNMNWNVTGNKFDILKIDLDMKNTTKGISAKLDQPAELVGPGKIPLTVKVAGKALNPTTPVTVATADAVKAGVRNTLSIEQTSPATRPDTGEYTGTLSIIFEPAA
jgi:hypothetical protein